MTDRAQFVPANPFGPQAKMVRLPAQRVLLVGPVVKQFGVRGVFGKVDQDAADLHFQSPGAPPIAEDGTPEMLDLESALMQVMSYLRVHHSLLVAAYHGALRRGMALSTMVSNGAPTRRLTVSPGSVISFMTNRDTDMPNVKELPFLGDKPLRMAVLVRDEVVEKDVKDVPDDLAEGAEDEGEDSLIRIRGEYRKDLLSLNFTSMTWVLQLGRAQGVSRKADIHRLRAPTVLQEWATVLVPFAHVVSKAGTKKLTEVTRVARLAPTYTS